MSNKTFIHLRTHSAYSLLEGAIKVKDVVKLAKHHHMPAVAVTDTNNMFGALEFALEAVECGIQPIMGCQLRLIDKTIKGYEKVADASLVLLAANEIGYKNLTQLVSAAYLDTPEDVAPHVNLTKLEKLSEGIIVLTGGVNGPIGQLLLTGQNASAEEILQRLIKVFPSRLYIELQRHKEGDIGDKQERTEGTFLDYAYQYNLPIVATNDVQFAIEAMSEAHDALLCIADKRYVSDTDRAKVTTNHFFKSSEEMEDLFDDLPEAIANTGIIAQRCAFWPKKHAPILPPFKTESGLDEVGELKRQAEEGLEARFKKYKTITDVETYRTRLAFELNVITEMGFAGYFLIVADFIKWSKAHNIPVGPGRGSGVGSLVAWALTITDLDPIPFGLLFERFLNPERVSMPDFDIDFCQERRDEVIGYVQQRYGVDKVAQIITFGKLQARAVLRNVGRVLGMPLGYVDKICKLVPFNPANPMTLKEAIQAEPQLKALRDDDASVGQLMDIAIKLEGLYAHASTHAAGLVIGDRPLQELVPMYRDPRSPLPVTQFNMKTVEQAGLVKFDFLGLKTLDVLQLAESMANKNGANVDLGNLPLDDAKTYEMVARGDTLGVFQLESAGMRDTLRRMKPNRFEDIIALVALYRPGPMDNIPKYIEVKAGREKADYLHPLLEPVLKETYGIAIYQEQVMQIAQILAGYTLGGADLLRRAMGKKIKEEMAAQRQTFIEGAAKNGVDGDQASMIFDQVDKFAGYGFNKSHAAAYALIAYQTAYMKANFPVAFYAASMTFEMGAVDKLNLFRQELTRKSIPLLPPDVNRSHDVFAIEDLEDGKQGIRYALAAIKGVGQAAMKALVAERESKGVFKDMFEFASRLDNRVMNKRQMENLINAGAFDGLHKNRAQLIEHVEMFTRLASAATQERESGQVSLFGGPATASKPQMQDVKPWDELIKLQNEFSALGFFLSSHPLDAYRPLLDRLGTIRASGLPAAAGASGSTRRKIAGIVISKQERTAKSGNRFAFVQLSDNTGMFEATLFSETLSQHRDSLVPGTPLLLNVDVQGSRDEYRLTVQGLEKLELVAARESLGLVLVLGLDKAIAPLQTITAKLPKGKSRIHIKIDIDGEEEAEIELQGRYTIPPELRSEIKGLAGILEVQDL